MAIPELFSSLLPLYTVAATLAFIALLWSLRLPRLSIILLLGSLVAGQLFRLPLPGQGGGVLFSDLALFIISLSALFHINQSSQVALSRARYLTLLFIPFLLLSLVFLLWRLPSLGPTNFLVALLYWLRLLFSLLLLPALLVLFNSASRLKFTNRYFYLTALLISLLGLLQLTIFPDLSFLTSAGWDPHQSRLVSTWLDPNFLGLFLVMCLVYSLGQISQRVASGSSYHSEYLAYLPPLLFLALLLTQSRSSLLALLLSLALMSPLILFKLSSHLSTGRIIRYLLLLALILLLLLPALLFLHDRLLGLFLVDETVHLRAASLSSNWFLAQEHALIGVGYNSYQFIAQSEGLITDYQIHSRAGSDNSFLNIWITSSLLGLVLFLVPWLYIFSSQLKKWLLYQSWPSLALALTLLCLIIHSQFVNSFLYSHLLITFMIIAALTYSSEGSNLDSSQQNCS